ncbi:MAG: PrsW family glutamic-type intramembrane protease [Candidatus Peribacteraceae bacterium]|nr:PrsW family glutamic-type intramembrane protease [Candidatus Peribacteraceae bacterium]
MSLSFRRVAIAMTTVGATLLPVLAYAADDPQSAAASGAGAFTVIGLLLALILLSVLLTKVWVGIVNVSLLDVEPIASIEKRHPYLPSFRVILSAIVATALLLGLSLKTFGSIAPFAGPGGVERALLLFGILLPVAIVALFRTRHAREFLFAFAVGTVVAFVLIGFQGMLLASDAHADPFFMALGVVGIALAWRFLFGPWIAHIKAAVLGTFLFWIVFHLLWQESGLERAAHLMAIGVALIPAVIWCALFLKYHWERMTLVVLMFFSGMLSTAPILFYDALVRKGVELQFFIFKIVPENFTRSSSAFITGNLYGSSAVQSTLLSTLLAFLLVGLIEEGSKLWVLRKSGQEVFRSINDVVELAIIVAIGFAFAENVINPTYFVGFVQQYLVAPSSADWGAFFGNVIGRSILTTMVHVVSTGVMGYFLGLAIFAGPYLEQARERGKTSLIAGLAQAFLQLPEKAVFRKQVMLTGLVIAVILHGIFNFMVSLPDLLPGNPRTLGDLFGAAGDSWLHLFSIILIPSLFYVLGGFWMLTALFYQGENRREHGRLVLTDTFVRMKNA